MKSPTADILNGTDFTTVTTGRERLRTRDWALREALARLGALLVLLLLVLLVLPRSAYSSQRDGIEARQTENGRVVYVNAEPSVDLPQAPVKEISLSRTKAGSPTTERSPNAAEIDAAIQETSTRHGVDANLVRAVVKVESNYNPRALSSKGAMGLMQLMPATARQLKVANPFDAHQNLDGGVRHLRDLLTSYNGDLRLSLAAYNAGAAAVARANGIPGFAETQSYVRQITSLYRNHAEGRGVWFQASSIRISRNDRGVLTVTND